MLYGTVGREVSKTVTWLLHGAVMQASGSQLGSTRTPIARTRSDRPKQGVRMALSDGTSKQGFDSLV